LSHPALENSSVLAVSSDDSPNLPGLAVRAGAHHFLSKRQVSEPLFVPLLEALLERARLDRELLEKKIADSRMEVIQRLLSTLRHEINNPLGAVLGGAYLMRSSGKLIEGQEKALKIIEASSNRIKHVMKQLADAAELEAVTKAQEEVFQVPGDPKW
jgi:signal transduction histidine kinase